MSDFRYRTDYNPDHYSFRRTLPGWYPAEPRETHADRNIEAYQAGTRG